MQPSVEIAWNRFYDCQELLDLMDRLQAAYPDLVRFEDIGHSHEGRVLRVMVLTNQKTGSDRGKPAMWVDGNVHGNEVQGSEAVLYLAWWLLEHYDDNERARELLDRRVFYLLPSQNPDGRDYWFHQPNTSSSSRSGTRPYDNDRDGQADEDPPDDLDGDGEILMMRKQVPMGTGSWRLDPDEPRLLLPVRGDQQGDYVILGSEGIDNDADGRINEDGPGGYDMNRNWPSDWQPGYVQYGAGDYPLCYPETRAIAQFIVDHPNIAAAQSFHNSGGMILRGPGDESIQYPRSDIRVYDELGKDGEQILPFYRYLILWKDLYGVHGDFVNWIYEGLGIFAFTNEMWSSRQYDGDAGTEREEDDEDDGMSRYLSGQQRRLEWSDQLLLADNFVDWHPVQHPLYGEVEVGGFKREHGRVPPSFMIEEMVHRNAMFCVRHAEAIADLEAEPLVIEPLGRDLWRVSASFRNLQLLPTRSGLAAQKGIGVPDRASIHGDGIEVLSGGVQTDRWRPEQIDAAEGSPDRILVESGIPSRGRITLVWIVQGGGEVTVAYAAEKAADVVVSAELE